ncbi:hypothetical protein NQZ68_035534 [Dissostichus eleginoides]|nr:hypothetical protein NQZ68_035534 [Dissostichus eleginoides]
MDRNLHPDRTEQLSQVQDVLSPSAFRVSLPNHPTEEGSRASERAEMLRGVQQLRSGEAHLGLPLSKSMREGGSCRWTRGLPLLHVHST